MEVNHQSETNNKGWGREIRAKCSKYWPLLLVGVSVVLSGFGLNLQSIWADEAASALLVDQGTADFFGRLLSTRGSEANQPLYYILLHYWVKIFGGSEVALRSLSLLFGAATIPIFYSWICLLEGQKAALLGAALYTLSSFIIWHLQEARPYALLLFISCWTYWAYVKYMVQNERMPLLSLVLAEIFGTYTSVLYVGVIGFVNVHYLFSSRSRLKRDWWVAQSAAVLLIAPFLVFNILRASQGVHTQYHVDIALAVGYAFWSFLNGFSIGPSVADLHGAEKFSILAQHLPVLMSLLMIHFLVAIAVVFALIKASNRTFYFLGIVIPTCFVSMLFITISSTVLPRYLIMVVPFLWAGVATAVVGYRSRIFRWGIPVILVGINAVSLVNLYTNPYYQKDDYRQLSRIVAEGGRNIPVYFIGPAHPLRYYRVSPAFRLVNLSDLAFLEQAGRDYPKYWLVIDQTRLWQFDPTDQISQRALRSGVIEEDIKVGQLHLYRMRANRDAEATPKRMPTL